MARNASRKTPRGRSSEGSRSHAADTGQVKRKSYPPRPRRPNRVLLAISGSLFLSWLFALIWLAATQS